MASPTDETRPVDLLPISQGHGIPENVADMLDEAIDLEGRVAQDIKGGRLVQIRLASGRRQRVQVLGVPDVPTGGPGLLIATPCAPAIPGKNAAMLRLNATLTMGAVGLRTLSEGDWFVLSTTVPIDTLTVVKLRSALRFIAERGDRIEETLVGVDRA